MKTIIVEIENSVNKLGGSLTQLRREFVTRKLDLRKSGGTQI